MKTRLLISVTLLLLAFSAQSQVIVKIIPVRPITVVVKPWYPEPKYIWVDGHWLWDNQIEQYVWVNGYWMKLKKVKNQTPGHWVGIDGRWKWIPGHMKK
jgi:hypothetical protein